MLDGLFLGRTSKTKIYWHFDTKLLLDGSVSLKGFAMFWDRCRMKKKIVGDLASWWGVGKVQVRDFVQQDAAQSGTVVRIILWDLERNVTFFEKDLVAGDNIEIVSILDRKRKALSSFLREWAKQALIQARISSIRNMGAASSFFSEATTYYVFGVWMGP